MDGFVRARLLEALAEFPVIGLLRRFPSERVVPLALAALEGGFRAVEVTMDSPDAAGQIRALVATGAGLVGAGTITSPEQVDEAVAAGAAFLVAPDFQATVIDRARAAGVPVIPGAFTPNEILAAWRAGADLVKVFPAGPVGPGWIRAVRAPMPDVPLVATGGIKPADVPGFLAAGVTAVALGSDLFARDVVDRGDTGEVKRRTRELALLLGR